MCGNREEGTDATLRLRSAGHISAIAQIIALQFIEDAPRGPQPCLANQGADVITCRRERTVAHLAINETFQFVRHRYL